MQWPARLHLHLRRASLPLFHGPRSFCSSSTSAPARAPPRKPRQASRRLLRLLSHLRGARPGLSAALDALAAVPHSLSPSHAAALVSAVANPLLAFDFYRFLRCTQGAAFRPDASLFASLLASQLGSLSPHRFRVRFYLGEMRKRGARLAYGQFRSLFGALFPGNAAFVGSFLDEVVEVLGPDSATFGAAMSVYAENGMVEEAFMVAERARREVQGRHAVEFYSSLMGLHRIKGDARAAMEAFLEMEEGGVAADEGIYCTLLETLCGVGWAKLCWVVLEEMARRGRFGLPESLGVDLMRAFLKRDMVQEAEWLLKEGILQEKESLLSFAELMAEKRMPLMAFELLKSTDHLAACAVALIQGCGKVGLIEEADKIFQDSGCSENAEVRESLLCAMIYVYTRAGLRRSAEIVWEELEASGCFTGEACTCMISMYGEMGLLADAEKVFDRWKYSEVSVSEDGYVALINALTKAGKLNKARDCLLEMQKFGIQPTTLIYSHVMEGYLKAGLPNLAARLLDEYKISGLTVTDGSTASTIVRILVQTGRHSELRYYLDCFRKSGVEIPKEKGESLMEMCREDSCLTKIALLVR